MMHERRPPFLVRVFREWWKDEVPYLASAVTFDALAASVPFMMLVLAVLGVLVTMLVPGGELDLRTFLRGAFPAARVVDLDPLLRVERLLEGVAARRVTVSLVSVPLLFVLSTRMFATARWALDRVFDAVEPRHLGHRWLVDAVLALLAGVFLMMNGVVSIGLAVLATARGVQGLAQVGGTLITFASALGLFVMVFRLAPARRIDWPTAWLAGGSCALFFEIAKRAFSLYVDYAVRLDVLTPDAQLAGIMLLLGWFYLNALVFLTAGELANEYSRQKPSPVGSS